jgi:hypothetical protein
VVAAVVAALAQPVLWYILWGTSVETRFENHEVRIKANEERSIKIEREFGWHQRSHPGSRP